MAEVAVPQVFTRRASGLVRVMSPYSAFIYNILTMGVIFPWTYLWAPTAFQGSNLVLGILFAFLFELPIALDQSPSEPDHRGCRKQQQEREGYDQGPRTGEPRTRPSHTRVASSIPALVSRVMRRLAVRIRSRFGRETASR